MASDSDPKRRPSIDESGPSIGFRQRIRESFTSIRQSLAVAGIGAVLIGSIIYIFIRDLEGAAFLVIALGGLLLLAYSISNWRQLSLALFGRRGRYGVNMVVIFIAFLSLAVLVNFLLFWMVNRPDPMGWLRVDTTATKQFILAEQALDLLDEIKEPIQIHAFFDTSTLATAAAWRDTRDLLLEFSRRSTKFPIEFELIDPELQPDTAATFRVTQFPALAIEGLNSRRVEVVVGSNPNNGPSVFNEQDVTTGLLVVNQIAQKRIGFVSGHSERVVTDVGETGTGVGLAAMALTRDNYEVVDITLNELGELMQMGNPGLPAAIIFAGPKQELVGPESATLAEYLRRGGNAMFLLDPDPPEDFKSLLGLYGIAVGNGILVDAVSFVAPNPSFLQVKNSNLQLPPHSITKGFDVLYFPGATFLGRSVDPANVPLTDDRIPFITPHILATTTVNSWAETDPETVEYDPETDEAGPLPIAVAVEALSDLAASQPVMIEGEYVKSKIVVIGDVDFDTKRFISSAKNEDMFANSVNWMVEDFELISIRSKVKAFRELVLTSAERNFVRWTGWLLMPVLVGFAGVWTWWRRR